MNRSLARMSAIILFAFISLSTQARPNNHDVDDLANNWSPSPVSHTPDGHFLTATLNSEVPAVDTQLQLPSIFTSGAVLQREVAFPVWGTASSEASVTVTFNGITETTQVEADGTWRVDFQAMDAGGPYTMDVVSGVETIHLTDMYIGDVWLASGQSNMEWTVSQLPIASEVIGTANDLQIRQFKVSSTLNTEETSTLPASSTWTPATSSFVGDFSAIGYFFAEHLRSHVDVPIGIINATYGGSRIETWMSEDMLGYDEQDVILGDGAAHRQPTMAYNAMIHPLLPFPVKGFLWYQGESNNTTLEDVTAYGSQFQTLIQGWRASWNRGDLPFIWVQLPNFGSEPGPTPSASHLWPPFRASQDSALVLPNTGQAITIDVGSGTNIHPPDKEPVGYRLSLIARNLVYGEDIIDSGPLHTGDVFHENGTVSISYDHVGSGLVADPDGVPGSFTLLGEDGTYVRAEAAIEGDKVVVWHNDVPEPVLVRYAWENNPINPNLYNSEGLPAAPFEAAVSPSVDPPGDPVTIALGDLKRGVSGQDGAMGAGYLMYSEAVLTTRFAANPPSVWAADHLIVVRFQNGQWEYDTNRDYYTFTPQPTDRLLAALDFTNDTADLLIGAFDTIEGIESGYTSGDLVITPNVWNGNPDNGEFYVEGTEVVVIPDGANRTPVLTAIGDQANELNDVVSMTLTASDADDDPLTFTAANLPDGLTLSGAEISGTVHTLGSYSVTVTVSDENGASDSETFAWIITDGEPMTLLLGDLNRGISGQDGATGTGYIMYSEQDLQERFANKPPSVWAADHLIVVRYAGQWEYDTNRDYYAFTPAGTDRLLAEVDFTNDTVTLLEGVNSVVEGIGSGYVSGDLTITPNVWHGSPDNGEFYPEGTYVVITGAAAKAARERDVLAAADVPNSFALGSIYPNPFSGTTTITYQLPEESPVRIEIFNITGQRVKVLIHHNNMSAGSWRSIWNGTDERGHAVAAGVYLVHLQADGYTETRKVVLVK